MFQQPGYPEAQSEKAWDEVPLAHAEEGCNPKQEEYANLETEPRKKVGSGLVDPLDNPKAVILEQWGSTQFLVVGGLLERNSKNGRMSEVTEKKSPRGNERGQ